MHYYYLSISISELSDQRESPEFVRNSDTPIQFWNVLVSQTVLNIGEYLIL